MKDDRVAWHECEPKDGMGCGMLTLYFFSAVAWGVMACVVSLLCGSEHPVLWGLLGLLAGGTLLCPIEMAIVRARWRRQGRCPDCLRIVHLIPRKP